MPNINPITAALIVIAAWPIIAGLFMTFSREGVQRALASLVDNLGFIIGIFLAVKLTQGIFFEHSTYVFKQIYDLIPADVQMLLQGKNIMIYLVMVPVFLALLMAIVQPVFKQLNRLVLYPAAKAFYSVLSMGGPVIRGLTGAIVQVPKAAFSVLLVSLSLNFLVYCLPLPTLSASMNESGLYQTLYQDVVYPLLNSNLAKNIPVIVNDAFAQAMQGQNADNGNSGGLGGLDDTVNALMRGRVIEYFNGVTLDEAVKSNDEIDRKAQEIVGDETNSNRKAYLIYYWVSQNIQYDYNKAARISADSKGIASGSIVAFNTRRGICFDYSSLYVSMCRAVGLKVRLVTGQGFTGTAWGDHAWNQVYITEEGRWVNVDTTFGNNANYFDKPDFGADHRYGQVQGEW